MNDEALNMSIRRFLKTVGVNSQLVIEKAVRKASLPPLRNRCGVTQEPKRTRVR